MGVCCLCFLMHVLCMCSWLFELCNYSAMICSHPFMACCTQEGNNYHKDVTTRHFRGPVLGYVTPW